ncbi:MAG TPA: glycosyltransferase [Candidatus Limnocylindrales bacterium]|nr:glycosyltransferase [Candidatus Limnocylindrales bacterium]
MGKKKQAELSSGPGPQPLSATGVAPPDTETGCHILVVHEVVPHTDRSGTDARLKQILKEVRAQGHRVTFVARNGSDREIYAPALTRLGIQVWAHDAERLRALGIFGPVAWKFEDLLRENTFDAAILSMWFWAGISIPEQYLDDTRRISPQTRIAVLTDDQHGERESQMAKLTGLLSDEERARDYARREIEICRRADCVAAISEDDRIALLAEASELEMGVVPMEAEIPPDAPGFSARSDLLFLGDFDNLANLDGMKWMLEEVWPRVRKRLPGAKLAIAGNKASREIFGAQEGVLPLGQIADLGPVFAEHRVFVSPIRVGTGIKTKNVAALAHGLALVTTNTGAIGMGIANGANALVADTPEELSNAIVRAYTDEKLWEQLSRGGKDLIAKEFSHEGFAAGVRRFIEKIRAISAKPPKPPHEWPCRMVEKRFPGLLQPQAGTNARLLRLTRAIQLADELLEKDHAALALAQLRHVFSFIRGDASHDAILAPLYLCLQQCYAALGDGTRAERCAQEARKCAPAAQSRGASKTKRAESPGKRKKHLLFSVVIPTYNRQATLATCLGALEQQTLDPADFEVIVVDDGSQDSTQEFCSSLKAAYAFHYFRQDNSGAGAARRAGAEKATGEYIVLFNDDTIAAPELLKEHHKMHRQHPREKLAVLGDFRYPEGSEERALSYFLSHTSFLFPQVNLKPGIHAGIEYFVTCNLSVRRDAVLKAGSFDPHFRVAEDSDLGIRLIRMGYRVLYRPQALAVHLHGAFAMPDMIRRARVYGRTQLALFRKYPQLLGDGSGPYGRLDEAAIERMRASVTRRSGEVEAAAEALTKFDEVEFKPYFEISAEQGMGAQHVMELFARAVPDVYFHYLYESFVAAWDEESQRADSAPREAAAEKGERAAQRA